MIIRCCRGVLQLAGAFAAGLVLIVLLAFWRLTEGPISIAFLTPYIEQHINQSQDQVKVKLGDTSISWAGEARSVDFRVMDVEVREPNGTRIAQVPEMAVSLSGRGMLVDHLIAPKSIELFGPRLRIKRRFDGSLEVGVASPVADVGGHSAADAPSDVPSDATTGVPPAALEARDEGPGVTPGDAKTAESIMGVIGLSSLFTMPDRAPPNIAYLSRIHIIGAEAVIEDEQLGRSWRAPGADLRLSRDRAGIQGELNLQTELEGQPVEVTAVGTYREKDQQLDVGINFSHVEPSVLAEFHHALEPLSGIAVPLGGLVTIGLKMGNPPDVLGFNLTGEAGEVTLPAPLEQTVPVERVIVAGNYDGVSKRTEISNFEFVAKPGAKLVVPGKANGDMPHEVPFKGLHFEGDFDQTHQHLTLRRLDLALDGPTISVEGEVEKMADAPRLKAEVRVSRVEIGALGTYWAAGWAPDAREWVLSRLSKGSVPGVTMSVDIQREPSGAFKIGKIEGLMSLENLTVDYLNPLPLLSGVSADARFTDTLFDFRVLGGETRGLKIEGGRVLITGFETSKERADVVADISGPLADALHVLDHEPLGYISPFGVKPETAAGDTRIKLEVGIPLQKDLPFDIVEIDGEALISGGRVPGLLAGLEVAEADLKLDVNKREMKIAGRGLVGGIAADIDWHEVFAETAPVKTSLKLTGAKTPVEALRHLGFDASFLPRDIVGGSVAGDLAVTVGRDGDVKMDIAADLAGTTFILEDLKWSKASGVPGTGRFTLLLDGKTDALKEVSRFDVSVDDLNTSGRLTLDPETGGISRVDFDRANLGRTELAGALIRRADGSWDAGFQGAVLDLSKHLDDMVEDDPAKNRMPPDFILALEAQQVWISDENALFDVSATVSHQKDRWETVLVKSVLDNDSDLTITIKRDPAGKRVLDVRAADAGHTFATFDVFDSMRGGKLKIVGTYDDDDPEQPLRGRLQVKDYRIVDAPMMARVVSVLALTGIVEALQGEGLAFAVLDVPFEKRDDGIHLKDARAVGPSLGFTAKGVVKSNEPSLDLRGTIVPAYSINSVLGKIPLLGVIFTGGDKGGGVFAANYTLTGETIEPKLQVNPLAALTPGFLRNIFGVLEKGGTNEAELAGEEEPASPN